MLWYKNHTVRALFHSKQVTHLGLYGNGYTNPLTSSTNWSFYNVTIVEMWSVLSLWDRRVSTFEFFLTSVIPLGERCVKSARCAV